MPFELIYKCGIGGTEKGKSRETGTRTLFEEYRSNQEREETEHCLRSRRIGETEGGEEGESEQAVWLSESCIFQRVEIIYFLCSARMSGAPCP